MKNRFFLSLFLLFTQITLWAQMNVDSLQNVFNSVDKKIEERLEAGQSLAIYYLVSEPKKAMAYVNESLEIAEGEEFTEDRAYLKQIRGSVFFVVDDYPSALNDYFDAQKLYFLAGDTLSGVNVNSDISNIYNAVKENDKALEILVDFNAYHRKEDNRSYLANGLVNIAGIYEEVGDYEQALINCEEAIEIYKEDGDTEGVAYGNFVMGTIHESLDDYDKATQAFKLALD